MNKSSSQARPTISELELEKEVLTRVMRLNATVHGIIFGLGLGAIVWIATTWLVIKGGPVVGPHLRLLGQFFLGYDVTILGSFVGFTYAFVLGFVSGFLTAKVYNALADLRAYGLRRKRRTPEAPTHPFPVHASADVVSRPAKPAEGVAQYAPSSNGNDHVPVQHE